MDIKSIIKEKGYTIQDVAKKMGVNRVTLTLTLQGNPTYKKLKEIADAIDCNIVDFFRDETNNSSTCKGEDSELTALIQYKENFYKADTIEELKKIVYEDLIKSSKIADLLGYEDFDNYDEVAVYPRGYRILSKIPRMPNTIVENLVKSFKSFQHILIADIQRLDEVDGIGEIRARTIKQSLKRMQEQFVFDNLIM